MRISWASLGIEDFEGDENVEKLHVEALLLALSGSGWNGCKF
jgi:hypothetical protein